MNELLEFLENECLDLRCRNINEEVIWDVVGHYMGKPYLRLIATGNTVLEALTEAEKNMNKYGPYSNYEDYEDYK